MENLYYHDTVVHNKNAARIILPKVFEISKPNSVIDVGCGIGTWTAVAKELGVSEAIGVDGDYVDKSKLQIPATDFITHDLRLEYSASKKYEMAFCLEVAEHLPEDCADIIVNSLVGLSDFILFSAAIPGQDGQNHLNEKPFEYWQEKFEKHNYVFYDFIRPVFWHNLNVEYWYRQNIFCVVKKNILSVAPTPFFTCHHPESYDKLVQKNQKLKQKLQIVISGKAGVLNSFKIFIRSILHAIGIN